MAVKSHPLVLHIDDDPDDIELVKEAIRRIDRFLELVSAPDGRTGLDKLAELHNQDMHPCLVILDINMPGMAGNEVVTSMKADPFYAKIPVILFSTSTAVPDKSLFEKHNIPIMTKPHSIQALEETIRSILKSCVY